MTVTTLSASAISSRAIFGLNQATREITDSTQRLASGIRFARASDDVGGLAISNSLNSQLVGMRQAQSNNLQANSMLQTAYSAASEINDILDSMKALAVQGNSGTLTTSERATLDLTFQELMEQVDSIATDSDFNGINLLDGSASGVNDLIGDTDAASQGVASFNFTGVFTAGRRVAVNGTQLLEGTDFSAGASANDSATNLYNALLASDDANIRALDYSILGDSVFVTAKAGGQLGGEITIEDVNGVGTLGLSGGATGNGNIVRLAGGADDGLARGSTVGVGTIGNSVIDTHVQSRTEHTLRILDNAGLETTGEIALYIDDGNVGFLTGITSDPTPTASNGEYSVGATASETLKNIVDAVHTLSVASDETYIYDQLEFEIDGDELIIRGELPGALNDVNGVIAGFQESMTASEGDITSSTGVQTGVSTADVVNSAFVGTVSGFSATYNSADNVSASITVGGDTYSADIADTNSTLSTSITFASTSGGSFTVDLAANQGSAVSNQDNADSYAARLDAAFSGLTFYQSRSVSNYTGAGQLAGGEAIFTSDDFSDTTVRSISVTSSASSDAIVEFDINGETFRSGSIGNSVGSYERLYLRSTTDSNRTLEISNGGGGTVDLSTETGASAFEATLRSNFGLESEGEGGLVFQVGNDSSDTISASIASATSNSLLDGETPDLLTQANAAAAETVIDGALEEVNALIAGIGASQSRLDFSYNATSSAIIEIDAARGQIADTDVASESTNYALAVVQQQAATAVLAQTQVISSNLLDLLNNN